MTWWLLEVLWWLLPPLVLPLSKLLGLPASSIEHCNCNVEANCLNMSVCAATTGTGTTTTVSTCVRFQNGVSTPVANWQTNQDAVRGCGSCATTSQQCTLQPCATYSCQRGQPSQCSVTCGKAGKQERHRTLLSSPGHGGKTCPKMIEVQDCYLGACPVDCEITEWGVVADCDASCGGGGRLERREITVNSDHGGEACPSDLERTVPQIGRASCRERV